MTPGFGIMCNNTVTQMRTTDVVAVTQLRTTDGDTVTQLRTTNIVTVVLHN